MATSVGSTGGTGNSGSTGTTTSGFSALTSEQFINVMIKQLQQQDPFKPQDSSALLEQISSIRNIESQVNLQDSLKNLVLQNQIVSAGNMIGKLVRGLDDSSNQVNGIVTAVRVVEGKAVLELDSGKTLKVNNVTAISNASGQAA